MRYVLKKGQNRSPEPEEDIFLHVYLEWGFCVKNYLKEKGLILWTGIF